MKPLAIDLYCGLGGWTEGLLAEGFDVIGFDIEQHVYGEHRYPAQLVLQDVRTIHGSQFKDASLIVASSPCQEYSYMAMPWTRAKDKARWYRDPAHPERLDVLNDLFNQPARIQREACEAAGRFIPMIQMGAGWRPPGHPDHVPGLAFNSHAERHTKNAGGSWFNVAHNTTSGKAQNPDGRLDGVKGFTPHGQPLGKNELGRRHGSKSKARNAASARIAKIPLPLAQWIAHCYLPRDEAVA